MRVSSPQASFKDYARSLGEAGYKEPSGFEDNWAAGWNLIKSEDRSTSRDSTIREAEAERKKQIFDFINDADNEVPEHILGAFSVQTLDRGDDLQYGRLTDYLRDKYGASHIRTDKEIMSGIRKNLQQERLQQQEVFAQQSGYGMAGMFGGIIASSLIDPIYLPTYFVGLGGMAKGAQVLKTVAKVAAVEAGAEALKQTQVYGWKEDIGVDYSLKDAAAAVATAAGVAGGITATVGGVQLGLKALARKARVNQLKMTAYEKMAADLNDANIDEMTQAPDADMSVNDYYSAVEGEQTHQLNRHYQVSEEDTVKFKETEEIDPELDRAYDELRGEEDLQLQALKEQQDEISTLIDCAQAGLI